MGNSGDYVPRTQHSPVHMSHVAPPALLHHQSSHTPAHATRAPHPPKLATTYTSHPPASSCRKQHDRRTYHHITSVQTNSKYLHTNSKPMTLVSKNMSTAKTTVIGNHFNGVKIVQFQCSCTETAPVTGLTALRLYSFSAVALKLHR